MPVLNSNLKKYIHIKILYKIKLSTLLFEKKVRVRIDY